MTTQVQSRPRSDAERRFQLRKLAANGDPVAQQILRDEEVARNRGAISKRIEKLKQRDQLGIPRHA